MQGAVESDMELKNKIETSTGPNALEVGIYSIFAVLSNLLPLNSICTLSLQSYI